MVRRACPEPVEGLTANGLCNIVYINSLSISPLIYFLPSIASQFSVGQASFSFSLQS